jgi:hypothetical protein
MKKSVNPERQIDFLLSLIRKDVHHYEVQEEIVNKWIHMSILSLKQSDTSLLEGLREEYKRKASMQILILKEFQKTLAIYQDTLKQV